jgi:hypothetical protein
MHQQVWRGAVHDDEDSYYSRNTGPNMNNNNDGNSSGDDGNDDNNKKTKQKKKSRAEMHQEIEELVEKYDVEDRNHTPQPDEALADFYA